MFSVLSSDTISVCGDFYVSKDSSRNCDFLKKETVFLKTEKYRDNYFDTITAIGISNPVFFRFSNVLFSGNYAYLWLYFTDRYYIEYDDKYAYRTIKYQILFRKKEEIWEMFRLVKRNH
jgi:hypothetical protein